MGVIMNYHKFNQYADGPASLKRFLLLSLWIKAQRLVTFMPIKLGSGNLHILLDFSFLQTLYSQLGRPMLPILTATSFLQPSTSEVFIIHRSRGYGIGSSPCLALTSRKSSNKGKSPAYTILAILYTRVLFHSLCRT